LLTIPELWEEGRREGRGGNSVDNSLAYMERRGEEGRGRNAYIHNMIEAQLDGGIITHAISLFHGCDSLRRSYRIANEGVRSPALSLGFHPLLPRAMFHKVFDSVIARYCLELELFLPNTGFKVSWKLLGPTFTLVLCKHGLQGLQGLQDLQG